MSFRKELKKAVILAKKLLSRTKTVILNNKLGYWSSLSFLIIFILGFNVFLPWHSALGFVFNTGSSSGVGGVDTEEVIVDSPNFLGSSEFQAFLASQPNLDAPNSYGVVFDLTTIEGNTVVSFSGPLTTLSSVNERNEIVGYIVQEGDNPTTIAASFGITVSSLLWANNLGQWSLIRPGQELTIPPVSGIIHKVKSGDTVSSLASKYKGNVDEIIAFNDLPADGSLQVSDLIVIPDGEMRVATTTYASYSPSVALPSVGGYFIWPLETNRGLTRGAHRYNAVDMKASCSTPIYAAAEGKVIIADGYGWNGGYGKYVKIQHPNGTQTLYSHAIKLLVGSGQQVNQGQAIALAGSTGRSTGCHLHFEVRGAKNPFMR